MSREAEARSGILGNDALEAARDVVDRHLPCWPMSAAQMAFARSDECTAGAAFTFVADRLHAIYQAGRDRFSVREVCSATVHVHHLDVLSALGLLRRHVYPSGKFQYVLTPYSRSWFMFIITRTKDTECPSSPSTPKPADSIPASTPC